MKRRTFLAGTMAGFTVGAGCLTRAKQRLLSAGPITSREFTITEANVRGDDSPDVRFDSDDGRVVVTGVVYVGSEKCKKAVLETVTYNPDTDVLRVVATDGKSADHPDNNLLGGGCDNAMSVDGYRVTIGFDGRLPGRVVAIQRHVTGGVPKNEQVQKTTVENSQIAD